MLKGKDLLQEGENLSLKEHYSFWGSMKSVVPICKNFNQKMRFGHVLPCLFSHDLTDFYLKMLPVIKHATYILLKPAIDILNQISRDFCLMLL